MEKQDSVKDVLQELIRLNKPGGSLQVQNADGSFANGTVNDLRELNYERLASIADLLGMSELYLEK